MSLRRALFIAACTLPAAVGPAAAQFVPPQPQQEPPPCIQEFMKLRADAEKKAHAIRTASEKKVAPKEACGLFNVFSAAEAKMVKYAGDKGVWCGIPNEIVAQLKASHVKTEEIRAKVCEAANAPRPRAPTLSDSLVAPVPDAGNIKPGKGTYDTLTGPALGTK